MQAIPAKASPRRDRERGCFIEIEKADEKMSRVVLGYGANFVPLSRWSNYFHADGELFG